MGNNKYLDKTIDDSGLSKKIVDKLLNNNINVIKDIWILKRSDLKKIGLTDTEINQIIVKLQLNGLDLNKKEY
jgi:5-bromo-4-chloroindolyl phosphate hydrolysis protein